MREAIVPTVTVSAVSSKSLDAAAAVKEGAQRAAAGSGLRRNEHHGSRFPAAAPNRAAPSLRGCA